MEPWKFLRLILRWEGNISPPPQGKWGVTTCQQLCQMKYLHQILSHFHILTFLYILDVAGSIKGHGTGSYMFLCKLCIQELQLHTHLGIYFLIGVSIKNDSGRVQLSSQLHLHNKAWNSAIVVLFLRNMRTWESFSFPYPILIIVLLFIILIISCFLISQIRN